MKINFFIAKRLFFSRLFFFFFFFHILLFFREEIEKSQNEGHEGIDYEIDWGGKDQIRAYEEPG